MLVTIVFMVKARLLLSLCVAGSFLLGGRSCAQTSSAQAPQLPVVDYKACPFEGCTFQKWIVTRDTPVFSTWRDDRKALGTTLKKGEIVIGLTGVHITNEPDRIAIRQPIPELHVQPGDIIFRYMEHGEGSCDLWAKGQWQKDYDCSFVTEPDRSGCLRDCAAVVTSQGKKDWWVQVKTPQGAIGWSKVGNQFDCMDSLAGDPRCDKLQSNTAQDQQSPGK